MKATIWGARGSIPAPGPETMRYGGNTSCVQLTLEEWDRLKGRRLVKTGHAIDGGRVLEQNDRFVVVTD